MKYEWEIPNFNNDKWIATPIRQVSFIVNGLQCWLISFGAGIRPEDAQKFLESILEES